MSTFQQMTKHPETGEWELATWHDDYFGRHKYGVEFPSEGTEVINVDEVGGLDTRDMTPEDVKKWGSVVWYPVPEPESKVFIEENVSQSGAFSSYDPVSHTFDKKDLLEVIDKASNGAVIILSDSTYIVVNKTEVWDLKK